MKILSKALFTSNRSRSFRKLKTGALIWTLLVTSPIPALAGLDDLSLATAETASAVPNPGFTRAFAPSEFAYPLCPTRNAGCLYVDAEGTPISNAVFDELREFTDQGVAPVRVGDKWGYVNKQGTWLFEPQFDEVPHGFYNGYASVRRSDKWGLISPTGDVVIDLISEKSITYAHGLALIETGGKTGFMDLTGNWVIAPTLYWALSFDQFGYAIARVKDGNVFGFKEGMIDRTGKWVVPPLYLDVENIQQNGLIRTRTFNNGSWGVQNLQGSWVVQPGLGFISEFDANGHATIRTHDNQGSKFGILDTKGRWIMRPKHRVTSGFTQNGLAAAREGFLQGYVNKANEWVIPPRLSSADKFAENGFAAVAIRRDDGVEKWGYINASGEWVIQPKYDFARTFNAFGLASVDIGPNYDDGRRGLIDEQGNWVFEPILSIFYGYGSTGYASASIDGKFGLLDTAGTWAVPPIYDFTSVVGELVKIGFGEYQYEGYVTRDGAQLGDLAARMAAASTQAPGIDSYQANCDAGDANACVGLYRAHLAKIESGNNRTPRGLKAIEALTLACLNKEAKLADACFTLARHHYLGDIVEQNTWDALVRFNRSCRYGSAEACVNVADGAMRRLSRFKDRESKEIGKRSLEALERACSLENAEGCYKLGMFHKERKYLQSEPAKAATFLEQSCNLAPARYCK